MYICTTTAAQLKINFGIDSQVGKCLASGKGWEKGNFTPVLSIQRMKQKPTFRKLSNVYSFAETIPVPTIGYGYLYMLKLNSIRLKTWISPENYCWHQHIHYSILFDTSGHRKPPCTWWCDGVGGASFPMTTLERAHDNSVQEKFYKEIQGISDTDQMQWLHAEELTALHHLARLL